MSARRLLAPAVALSLPAFAAAAPAPAYAEPVTVPGCYGVAVVVCDPQVTGVESYTAEVPICVGSCTYVPVTLVRPSDGEAFCVQYRPLTSTSYEGGCADAYSYGYWDEYNNTNVYTAGACAESKIWSHGYLCGEVVTTSNTGGQTYAFCVRQNFVGNEQNQCWQIQPDRA